MQWKRRTLEELISERSDKVRPKAPTHAKRLALAFDALGDDYNPSIATSLQWAGSTTGGNQPYLERVQRQLNEAAPTQLALRWHLLSYSAWMLMLARSWKREHAFKQFKTRAKGFAWALKLEHPLFWVMMAPLMLALVALSLPLQLWGLMTGWLLRLTGLESALGRVLNTVFEMVLAVLSLPVYAINLPLTLLRVGFRGVIHFYDLEPEDGQLMLMLVGLIAGNLVAGWDLGWVLHLAWPALPGALVLVTPFITLAVGVAAHHLVKSLQNPVETFAAISNSSPFAMQMTGSGLLMLGVLALSLPLLALVGPAMPSAPIAVVVVAIAGVMALQLLWSSMTLAPAKGTKVRERPVRALSTQELARDRSFEQAYPGAKADASELAGLETTSIPPKVHLPS